MNDRQHIEKQETYKYSAEVAQALSSSVLISYTFDSDEVTPLHLFLAFLLQVDCPIRRFFLEENLSIEPEILINNLVTDTDLYTKITGESSPFVFTNSNESEHQKSSECQDESTASNTDENEDTSDTENDSYYEDFYFSVSDSLREIIYKTAVACLNGNQNFIDASSLLYALIYFEDYSVKNFLDYLIISCFGTKKSIACIMDFMVNNYHIFHNYWEENIIIIPKDLSNCCTVMNTSFTKGVISDIYGREAQLKKLWTVFSKKTKRNAILVGDPGVGKTAIVEHLVQNIVNESCPISFKDYTVISLNITSMVSGTKYRGEFEQKIDSLISFLQTAHKVILFIDEVHHMLGAGSSNDSSLDLSGALKPLLSRDDVIVLGATTYAEYEQIISRDTAFKRRFEIVEVKGPKFNEIKPMILGRVTTLSKFHKVKISDKVLDYVILLSCIFGSSTNQPDASIDLLDKSMAVTKLRGGHSVTPADVKSIFEDCFQKFEKQSKSYNKVTAVHEAGHYIAFKVYEDILNSYPIAVSIVPSFEFAGVTLSETKDCISNSATFKFTCAKASALLAGRLAQELYSYDYDSGADSDLERANEVITHMLLNSGMAQEYPNIVFSGSDQADVLFNPRDKENIAAERKKIIDEISKNTLNMLKQHKKQLDEIVKLLMRKYIVDYYELDAVYSKNADIDVSNTVNSSDTPTGVRPVKRKIGSKRKKIFNADVS